MSRPAAGPTLVHHVSLAIVQVCFGLFPVIGKSAFDGGFAPGAVAAWRLAAGGLLLGGLAFALYGRRAVPLREDLLRMVVASALGIAINQICFLEGLARSRVVNAGLMIGMIPAMTYLVALLARQERIDLRRGCGIVIGLAAVLQLILVDAAHLLGDALLFTNMLVYSVYLVVSRPLLERYPPIVATAWMFLLSWWLLPISTWDADLFPSVATSRAWWALAYVVVFPTILGYLLNLFAMTRLPSSTAATYTFSQPVIIIVSGVAVSGDVLGLAEGIAVVGVFVAMWLVLKTKARK